MPNKTHFSLLLVLTFVYSTVVAQDKLPKEAEAAVQAYESKIEAIQKEQEAKRLAARTELDQILLTQQQAAIAAGDQMKRASTPFDTPIKSRHANDDSNHALEGAIHDERYAG